MENNFQVLCRICHALIVFEELSEHCFENHYLDYIMLQGQLESFDRQHGFFVNEYRECTSRYVAHRREQRPHDPSS